MTKRTKINIIDGAHFCRIFDAMDSVAEEMGDVTMSAVANAFARMTAHLDEQRG